MDRNAPEPSSASGTLILKFPQDFPWQRERGGYLPGWKFGEHDAPQA
jgi:hypothetical protein